MASIEDAFSISDGLEIDLYKNESLREDLFKTVIVTEDELLNVRNQFNPDTYIAEARDKLLADCELERPAWVAEALQRLRVLEQKASKKNQTESCECQTLSQTHRTSYSHSKIRRYTICYHS